MAFRPLSNAIFVCGIAHRSGTNFLSGLLALHPECRRPRPIWEDYLLEHSELLVRYAHKTYSRWASASPSWGVDPNTENALCHWLGHGLVSFLEARAGVPQDGGRLLTKTPSVAHLDSFFELFPGAYLLILVRDGRDVVESAARSFNAWRDGVAAAWADAAETILRFDGANRGKALPYRIVRYEALYLNLDDELRELLHFLDLDPGLYDFQAASELPVRGSSTHRGGRDSVQWNQTVARTPDFKPIGRWKDWDRRMHERFNWIAGEQMTKLGYELEAFSDHLNGWRVYNQAVDTVAKHRLYRLVPSFLWNLCKRGGHGLLRLAGVQV